MSDPHRTPFQFAMRTKPPGDRAGYRILASSAGPRQGSDFSRVFDAMAVGNVLDGDRADPIATFAPHDAPDGIAEIACVIQELTDARDGTGQEIAALSCVCAPFAVLAAPGVTYRGTFDAIMAAKPTYDACIRDEPTLFDPLTLPAMEPARDARLHALAGVIDDEIGFTAAARIAAWLLESPVTLVNAGTLSVEERLDGLDAIAALLPYGCRADLAVSTWAAPRAAHRARLAFSSAAREGQQRIVWGGDIPELPPSSAARRYYDLLCILRANDLSTGQIVLGLANHTDPMTLDDLEPIIRVARALDLPHAVLRDCRAGNANPEEIRRIFQCDEAANLKPSEQSVILEAFLPYLAAWEDLQIVVDFWQVDLSASLCSLAGAYLRAAKTEKIAVLLTIADAVGEARILLTDLLAGMESHAEPDRYRSLASVLLWYNATPETLAVLSPALGRHRALHYEVFAQHTPDTCPPIYQWLLDDAPDRDLFQIAAGHAATDATDTMIAAIGESGAMYIRCVYEAAHDRLILLSPILRWLDACFGTLSESERRCWQTLLGETAEDVDRMTVPLQAAIDLTLLCLGGSPIHLPRLLRKSPDNALREYGDEVGGLLSATNQPTRRRDLGQLVNLARDAATHSARARNPQISSLARRVAR
jgi:hypothetical protein